MKVSTERHQRSRKKLIGQIGELVHGKSKKFTLRCGGNDLEAVLINFEGEHFAYLNRCRHIGISLDWVKINFSPKITGI